MMLLHIFEYKNGVLDIYNEQDVILAMFSNLPGFLFEVTKTNLTIKVHFKDNQSSKSSIATIDKKSYLAIRNFSYSLCNVIR
jgi:hypothetical protein